jgi:hypothetical protein
MQPIEETFIVTIKRYADGRAFMSGFKSGQKEMMRSEVKKPQKGMETEQINEVKQELFKVN